MSNEQPSPTGEPTPSSDVAGAEPRGEQPPSKARTKPQTKPSTKARTKDDPLRGSRTSGIWAAVLALVLVVILLAVFILQNTQTAEVSFLGWTGSAPLSATLLISAAGGALLVASAGVLRILQLRRRVKRERKRA